jgi:hypothetical protein
MHDKFLQVYPLDSVLRHMTCSKSGHPLSLRLLALALVLTCLMGCGGTPPPTPAPVFPNVTGNWQFELQILVTSPPALPLPPIVQLFGSLVSSGSEVAGTLNARPGGFPACVANNADLPVKGTVDATGNITLTVPIAGGVATIISATQSARPPLANGTYQVIGGACAQSSVGLNGFEVLNVSGTYAGTLAQIIPSGSGSLSVTATLDQSPTPNADGEYPLTGTVTYSGDCSGTLLFNNGIVFGEEFQSAPLSPDFGTSTELFSGGIPLTGLAGLQPLGASFFLPAGCSLTAYTGTLTRQ